MGSISVRFLMTASPHIPSTDQDATFSRRTALEKCLVINTSPDSWLLYFTLLVFHSLYDDEANRKSNTK